ncbi:glutathione S-transferase T3-like [Setaria italica]|uniref:glutathione S-transferase T3-like n=1 Tax=Setaria italica TaxID=4555 RepID=UPI0003509130|nr:glutathione S-transferase T3-like [Setaria italica]
MFSNQFRSVDYQLRICDHVYQLKDKDPHPSGGFMNYFRNQPHNFHLVGQPIHNSPLNKLSTNNDASSQPEVEILDNDNVRTEKRILWTEEEDLRLMSAWIEHSTDSTCGADKGGNQYWGEVVESYNKTTPPLRKRNLKQCKDRWHKINRWTDLFECAYVKARRVFTSGYSDQMWIDAAHKFYVEDNKDAKLGPFVGIEVWKICREVSKWKTYNEELRNARKRKSFHLEEERDQGSDESLEEMPNRPMGQKAAKKAALAAKGKSKGSSSDDGNSKESAIDLDKLGRFSKIQEETNANRMKILELQQKLSSEKLETTKVAHLTAQETKEGKKLEKESKMMEAYNSLILQDTSSMSDVEKAERVAAMKCLRKALFPESD